MVTAGGLALLTAYLPFSVAYTLMFALGVVLSTVLTGPLVFRARLTRGRSAALAMVYVVAYAVGLSVVRLMGMIGVDARYSCLVVLVSAPITYLGGRLVFARPHAPRAVARTPS